MSAAHLRVPDARTRVTQDDVYHLGIGEIGYVVRMLSDDFIRGWRKHLPYIEEGQILFVLFDAEGDPITFDEELGTLLREAEGNDLVPVSCH